jgi:hypothetical protein
MATEIWKWIQKQNIGPPSRFVSSMTYDLDLKKVILFGGGSIGLELAASFNSSNS